MAFSAFMPGCPDCPESMICVRITDQCNLDNTLANQIEGVFIEISNTDGGTPFASGTTTGQVISLTALTGGSGYNDGTYPLTLTGGGGSGVVGYFTVSGGKVVSTIIVSGGGGYSSSPTPDFSIAGGSGASATANLALQWCFHPNGGALWYRITKSGLITKHCALPTVSQGVSYIFASYTGVMAWQGTITDLAGTPIPGATISLALADATAGGIADIHGFVSGTITASEDSFWEGRTFCTYLLDVVVSAPDYQTATSSVGFAVCPPPRYISVGAVLFHV